MKGLSHLVKGPTTLVGVVVPNLFLVVAPHLVAEVVVLAASVRVDVPFLKIQ